MKRKTTLSLEIRNGSNYGSANLPKMTGEHTPKGFEERKKWA